LAINFEERHHAFEACFNFRDIGGYEGVDGRTVRWGRYFRAGRQDRMTENDLARVKELGIATQIDLRKPEEIQESGRGPLESMGARYEVHPVIPAGGSIKLNRDVGVAISGGRYLGYLKFDSSPIRNIFERLANTDRYPVVVHCTAGKDRTGVITALTLSLLGVDRTIIEEDYILTNRDVMRQIDWIENGPGFPEGIDREWMLQHAGVPDDAMGVFLDGLESKFGGPAEFLRGIGIGDDKQDGIREALLEPAWQIN